MVMYTIHRCHGLHNHYPYSILIIDKSGTGKSDTCNDGSCDTNYNTNRTNRKICRNGTFLILRFSSI